MDIIMPTLGCSFNHWENESHADIVNMTPINPTKSRKITAATLIARLIIPLE